MRVASDVLVADLAVDTPEAGSVLGQPEKARGAGVAQGIHLGREVDGSTSPSVRDTFGR